MRLNLNQQIYNTDGSISQSKIKRTVMTEVNGEIIETQKLEDKPVTLGAMLIHSVLKGTSDTSIGNVTTRYNIFKKLNVPEKGGKRVVHDLTDEEIDLIKTMVCDSVEIFYAGQILEIINSKE